MNNRGFTLVELMVVVLIIAILMGVAVPIFLGARRHAQDNVAKQALANAARAAAAYHVLEDKLPDNKDEMYKIEGTYIYEDDNDGEGAPAFSNPPSIAYDRSNSELRAKSENGTVWKISIANGQIGPITRDE